LLERPRMQSVPRAAYHMEYDEYATDFDMREYSYKLQTYLKEKIKLTHNKEYKEEVINKMKQSENGDQEQQKHPQPFKLNKKRGPGIDENVRLKIVDLGNACWINHHFSTEIQTRQYRSPEVILGVNYDTSADIWSNACMIFELVTGDFLFEPRKGDSYSKSDDHLAQIIELLGKVPKKLGKSGKYSKKHFDSKGNLRRIKGLQHWPLKNVLMEKYRIKEEEATAFADFILPMLSYHPDQRATAQEMLRHPWLNMPSNFDYYMTDREYQAMMMKNKDKKQKKASKDDDECADVVDSDVELNMGDDEDNDEYESESDGSTDSCGAENEFHIQNFNNSFAAYGQHIDLDALDRANPQFDVLK